MDWMEVKRGSDNDNARKRLEQEIEERAGLFFRLRYPEAQAIARIQANLRWENDPVLPGSPVAALEAEVPHLVAKIYARRPNH
jgi:hypothetical protein